MKKIPLGGKLGEDKFALVDDVDYDKLSRYSWCLAVGGYATGGSKAQRELGHHFMHRVVNNTPKGKITDHIDGNPLNNTRGNLRTVDHSQNLMNARIRKNKNSKYKGVWWNKRAGFWYAAIRVNGGSVNLGNFETQREAAIAYNEAATKNFGEYAKINDIPDIDPADKKVVKIRQRRGGRSQYVGVTIHYGSYAAFSSSNGKKVHLGSFPSEKFAAKVYDSYAIDKFGEDAFKHINFQESISNPISLDKRYIFKAIPKRGTRFLGVCRHAEIWRSSHNIKGKKKVSYFKTEIEAAENKDKLILIHGDDICTYLNFPEKLDEYLDEIGDQILSAKLIEIPVID